MAKLIPGKEEFEETLRYFRTKLNLSKIDVCAWHYDIIHQSSPFVVVGAVESQCHGGRAEGGRIR